MYINKVKQLKKSLQTTCQLHPTCCNTVVPQSNWQCTIHEMLDIATQNIKYSVLQDYHTGYKQTRSNSLVGCIASLAQNQMQLLFGMTFCITRFVISICYITTGTIVWYGKEKQRKLTTNETIICDMVRKKKRKLACGNTVCVDNYVVSHHKLCTQNVVQYHH